MTIYYEKLGGNDLRRRGLSRPLNEYREYSLESDECDSGILWFKMRAILKEIGGDYQIREEDDGQYYDSLSKVLEHEEYLHEKKRRFFLFSSAGKELHIFVSETAKGRHVFRGLMERFGAKPKQHLRK